MNTFFNPKYMKNRYYIGVHRTVTYFIVNVRLNHSLVEFGLKKILKLQIRTDKDRFLKIIIRTTSYFSNNISVLSAISVVLIPHLIHNIHSFRRNRRFKRSFTNEKNIGFYGKLKELRYRENFNSFLNDEKAFNKLKKEWSKEFPMIVEEWLWEYEEMLRDE